MTRGEKASGTPEAACAFAKTAASTADANKRKVALVAASAGIQARGRRLDEIIPEYKAKLIVEVSPSEAKTLVVRDRLKIGKRVGTTVLTDDAQILAVSEVHGEDGGPESVRVELGIAWSPSEFLEQAAAAEHPFDSLVVSSDAAVAVAKSLSHGAKLTRTHQEDTLRRWPTQGRLRSE